MWNKRLDQTVRPSGLEPLAPRLLMSAASASEGTTLDEPAIPALSWIAAATEAESEGGPSNDDMADAQELSFSRMLPDQPRADGYWPQQAVVDGTADGAGGEDYDWIVMWVGPIAPLEQYELCFGDVPMPGEGGVLTIFAKADLEGATKYLSLEADELLDLGTVFVDGGAHLKGV